MRGCKKYSKGQDGKKGKMGDVPVAVLCIQLQTNKLL